MTGISANVFYPVKHLRTAGASKSDIATKIYETAENIKNGEPLYLNEIATHAKNADKKAGS